MKFRMSIARCCCDIVGLVFVAACRAWNTEGSYTYDKLPTVSGVMPSGTTRTNVSTIEPYENHNAAIERVNFLGKALSDMNINPVGGSGVFTIVSKGLSSQTTALVFSDFCYGSVGTNIDSVYPGVPFQVEDRYSNKFSYPAQAPDMVIETTINVSAMPPYATGTAGTAYRQYSLITYEQGTVARFGVDSSGYITYLASTLANVFPTTRMTVSGVDVAVTAPFTITIRKPSSDNGTTDIDGTANFDHEILVNGVLTDQIYENNPRNCVFADTGWTAAVYPPQQVSFGTQLPTTTSDMTLTVTSIDYLIGSGEVPVTAPTFTADSPWTVVSGVITCDNTLVTTSIGTPSVWANLSTDKKATATVTLTNSTLHRIKFECLAIDPAPLSPENGTGEQPVVAVDGAVISATRSASTLYVNRETEEYFFTSAASGDTTIDFYGYKETEYTISNIEIVEIPA